MSTSRWALILMAGAVIFALIGGLFVGLLAMEFFRN